MAEKGTMTATFEPTLDVWKLLEGKPTEYIVVNPTIVEAKFKDGEVRRYPQEIRERVTRCRDCVRSGPCVSPDHLTCYRVGVLVTSDGFCAWGEPRVVSE